MASQAATTTALLDVALAYAGRGWAVLPTHSIHNGRCTCGKACSKPGKHPWTEHGLSDASTDPAVIRGWWRRWPNANIGVRCGQVSGGLVAVDVDGEEGKASLNGHALPPTVMSATGGGGWHYLYVTGESLRPKVGLLPKVDLRAEDSYIVAPPSAHISGRPYEWLVSPDDAELAALPKWVSELAAKAQKPATASPVGETIPTGERNETLTRLAGAMRRKGMRQESIEAALLAENQATCSPPLGDDEVRRIAASVSRYEPPAGDRNPVPSPKDDPAPWPSPLEQDAFHGLTGDVVATIRPHTEADDAALLISFLVAFGNAVGREPHGIAEADRHGCNLFAVLVGDTSKGRKGTTWGRIRELFRGADEEWVSTRVSGGLSSGEGVIWAVRDAIERTVPIKDKGRATGEYETVTDDMGVSDKRLLAVESEFASVLKMMGREGNTLSPIIREAWDRGDLRALTKNSPARATGAHISIVGHVTKTELLRYLGDTEGANGFANRFLWVCTKRARVLPEGGGSLALTTLADHLRVALEHGRRLGRLQRDAEARGMWAEVYPELSEGKPGMFGGVTGRAEAQVLRLCLAYAVIDGADAISPVHLKAALAVWEYCEASARHIFGDATGDRVADQIIRALRSVGELSRTDINNLLGRNTPAARIEAALRTLESAHMASSETRKQEDGGRPVEVWRPQ